MLTPDKRRFPSLIPQLFVLVAACGYLSTTGIASAQMYINFDTAATPEGAVVSTQFLPDVSFISSPLSGDDSAFYGTIGYNLGTWGTNTDMTVTGTDVAMESSEVAGIRQLHAYGSTYAGFLSEDGDPAFLLNFSQPISSISVVFAGDNSGSSGLAVFTAGTLSDVVHVAAGAKTQLETATLSGIQSSSILVVPGAFRDWSSVVSITYTTVPEASTEAIMAAGALLIGITMLRRRLQGNS